MVCVICGTRSRPGSNRQFFKFPCPDGKKLTAEEKVWVAERRRLWFQLVAGREKLFYGEIRICSIHFHQGLNSYH